MSKKIELTKKGEGAPAAPKKTPPEESEILPPDPLQEIINEVETTKDEQTRHEKIGEAVGNKGLSDIRLGGLLLKAKTEGRFGVHGSFEELCSAEVGIGKDEADQLIEIYVMLATGLLPWADLKELGWHKFSMLCDWLYAAGLPLEFCNLLEKGKAMTVVELQQSMEKLVDCEPIKVKTLTYKPPEDQAETIAAPIDKAKEEAATELDKITLSMICDYLAASPLGAVMPAGFSITVETTDGPVGNESAAPDIDDDLIMARLQQAGPDKARELVEEALPGWTVAKCAPG